MSSDNVKTNRVALAEAELKARRARMSHLRAEIEELDGQEQEAARAVAGSIANGEKPGPLRATHREIRAELEDSRAAVTALNGLIRSAEAEVKAAQRAEALVAYRKAVAAEVKHARTVEKLTGQLAVELNAITEAERLSYSHGRGAGVESATHYRRRHQHRERFLGSVLGHWPHVPNAYKQTELAAPLVAMLPADKPKDD